MLDFGNIDEVITGDAQFGPDVRKVFINQPERKFIIARRDRGMRGEDIGLADQSNRVLKGHAFFHIFHGAFQGQECGMAFVHVPGGGFITQRPQSADAAHPQQNFLRDPQFQIADIQPVGQLAVVGIILGNIGMQEVKMHPANVQLVNPGKDLASRQVNGDLERLAVLIHQANQREGIKINRNVIRMLPAVFADALGEIAIGIDKANTHQGNPQVAGFLQMVAGENSQAAGINHQGFMQAKLKGEIGHQVIVQFRIGLGEPGVLLVHIAIKFADNPVIFIKEIAVIHHGIEPGAFHIPQESHGVVIGVFPKQCVNFFEEPLSFRMPNPPQIKSQIAQPFKPAGQVKFHRSFFNNFSHKSNPLFKQVLYLKWNAC